MHRNRFAGLLMLFFLGGCAEDHCHNPSSHDTRNDRKDHPKRDDGKSEPHGSVKFAMRSDSKTGLSANTRYASAVASAVSLPNVSNATRFESNGDALLRLDVFYLMHGPTIPPNPTTAQYGSFSALLGPDSVATLNDDGLQLEEGWLFMTGWYPWVQTSVAHAGAEGSTLIVRRFRANPANSDMTVWVFRVGGNAWVRSASNAVQQQGADGHYWELAPNAANFVEHDLTSSTNPDSPYMFFNRAKMRARLIFP